MEKHTEKRSPFLKQCFVAATIYISLVGIGCAAGYPAVLLPQLARDDSLIKISPEQASWLGIMNKIGRRAAFFFIVTPPILAWVVCAMATNYAMLMFERIVQGFCIGLNFPLKSVLIGECTSPKYRGAFLMLIPLGVTHGIFFVHFIGSMLHWQRVALVCMIFPFSALIMAIYLPESPSFLAANGKVNKCRKTFRRLRGDNEEAELEELFQARISHSEKSDNDLSDNLKAFKKREFYIPLIIMTHAYALIALSGEVSLNNYSYIIFKMVLGTEDNIPFWVVVFDVLRIFANSIGVYLIQKFKRRTMLFVTGTGSVVSHLATAGYVLARNRNILFYDAMWIPVALLSLQCVTIGAGMLSIPSVIAGEVFPFKYRGIGGCFSALSMLVFSFTVLKSFSALKSIVGIEGVYALNGAGLVYLLTVIWFTLPETKGKTLQQIEDGYKRINKQMEKEETPLNIKESETRIQQL